jgi:hypothetical protein
MFNHPFKGLTDNLPTPPKWLVVVLILALGLLWLRYHYPILWRN